MRLERKGNKNNKEKEKVKGNKKGNNKKRNRPFFENIAKNLFGIIKL